MRRAGRITHRSPRRFRASCAALEGQIDGARAGRAALEAQVASLTEERDEVMSLREEVASLRVAHAALEAQPAAARVQRTPEAAEEGEALSLAAPVPPAAASAQPGGAGALAPLEDRGEGPASDALWEKRPASGAASGAHRAPGGGRSPGRAALDAATVWEALAREVRAPPLFLFRHDPDVPRSLPPSPYKSDVHITPPLVQIGRASIPGPTPRFVRDT